MDKIYCLCVCMAILRFLGGVLLGGSFEEAELELELRESMGLALFCLNALISCPDTVHSSLKN